MGGGEPNEENLNTNSSALPSVGNLDWHMSKGRPGLLLESVWHSMQSYCLSGATRAIKCTLIV